MLRQRFLKPVVLMAAVSMLHGRPVAAQPSTAAPEFDIRPRELRLDGTIRGLQTARDGFVLNVTSFTRSDASTYRLPEPQSRDVLINAATVLHVRGSQQEVRLTDLREGTFAIVIAVSLPGGESWQAREVAAWSRVEAGGFLLDESLQRPIRTPWENAGSRGGQPRLRREARSAPDAMRRAQATLAAAQATRAAGMEPPTIVFSSLSPDAVYDRFPVIAATVFHPRGVQRVDVYISRDDTGQSWTGSGWSAPWTLIPLPTTLAGGDWSYAGAVPGAESGTYTVRANVYDGLGRNAGGRGVRFRIERTAALPPLSAPPADPSPPDLPPADFRPSGGATNPLRTLAGHSRRVTATAFSPDGTLLASASADTTVRIWNVATGQQRQILRGHRDVVTTVAFSSNGAILATGSGGVRPDGEVFGEVELWNARTGQWLQTLTGHEGLVKTIAFSADGKMLATGANDGQVRLWVSPGATLGARWREKLILPRPPARYRPVQAVGFSSGGLNLTVLHTDWAVFRYSTQSGTSIQGMLSGPSAGVVLSVAALSPDGALVAVGNETTANSNGGGSSGAGRAAGYGLVRLVRLWTPDVRLHRTLRGHRDTVTAMAFSPNGTMLATGSRDSTVSLWDMRTVTGERRLGKHSDRITAMAFSPKGAMLATGSDDATIKLWNVQPVQPRTRQP